MNISFEQIEAFVTTVQKKSFSAAGRHLGKTQSAISTAIINLEIDLSVSLFDRSGRYPELTPEGHALMREAEAILSHCSALQDRAHGLNMKVESKLAIAIDDAIPYSAVSRTLRDFEAQFPDLELEVLHLSQEDILQSVIEGKVTLGLSFVQMHYPKEVAFCRLGSITFTNAVHRSHPLANKGEIGFGDLCDFRQIVVAPHGKQLPTAEYLKSPRRWFVESYLVLLEMAKDGLGWAILPKRLVKAELESGEMVELPLAAYPFTEWVVGVDLIWSTALEQGKAASWLKAELRRKEIYV